MKVASQIEIIHNKMFNFLQTLVTRKMKTLLDLSEQMSNTLTKGKEK